MLIALVMYFVYTIISIQIQIYNQKRALVVLQERIYQQQLENDELRRKLSEEGEEEYIERIAREKLGYAAPDERVFVDKSE